MVKKVGIVGTGVMGSGLAKRLVSKGYEVCAWNRTRERALALTKFGVKVVNSIAELVKRSETIHIFVSDDEAVRAVVYGKGGIFESVEEGKLVINHSTVTPPLNIQLYRDLKEKNVAFLECPVLGSWPEAEKGKLDSLVGGEEDLLRKYEGLFNDFSKLIFYTGPVGTAAALKLATNMMLFNIALALSESMALVSSWNLNPKKLLEYFKETWLKPVAERYGERLLAKEFPTRFRLVLAAKDLAYAVFSARDRGQPLPLTSASLQTYLEAAAYGMSDKDYSRVFHFINKRAVS